MEHESMHTRYGVLRLLLICSVPAVLITLLIVVIQRHSTDNQPLQNLDTARGSQFTRLGPDNPPSPESFAPFRVLGQQPPITEIKLLAAKDVQGEVDPDELVLGIVIDGEARAYPLNGLTGPTREIYNDVLAGRAIAATW